jgi:hypothetical protein
MALINRQERPMRSTSNPPRRRATVGLAALAATGLADGAVSLIVDGGAGTDVLSGGPGTVLVP